MHVFRQFACALALALLTPLAAMASTYVVHIGGVNSGLDWSTLSGAFAQALSDSGDHTIEIQDDNAGLGYTEPRMDLNVSKNITITATVPVKIMRDASASPNELFRNLSTGAGESKLSIIGLSAAAPITLYSDKAESIVSFEDPSATAYTGLLHLENVVLEKATTVGNGYFLRVDSRAVGQQYLKNVTFKGGLSSNTSYLMRAGSSDPASAQDLYLEGVTFNQANGSTGMMEIYNRATIEAKTCIFRPVAVNGNNMVCIKGIASNAGLGAVGGSQVVFRDCEFQSQNNLARDAFVTLGETFQTTPNVYKFYRPKFYHCGANMFNMADRPCEVHVLGLDDSDQPTVSKVDFNTIPSGVSRYALFRGNNKFVLRYCAGSYDVLASTKSIGSAGGALTGNPQLEIDHCEFKGTGIISFAGSGVGFAPVITLKNSVFISGGVVATAFINTDGTNTGNATVTMEHCTFTRNSTTHFLANAGDLYYGPGTIFDGSVATTIAAFALQASSVPCIAYNASAASGFTSVPVGTIISHPQLSTTGRLTTASTAAFGNATGSTATTDIDGDARPNPVGSTPDIGADEVTAPVSVTGVQVLDASTVRVTFDGAVGASALTQANYTVSGTGLGTLTPNPDVVAAQSSTAYDLTWSAGEMHIGGDITVTVANVLDAGGFALGIANSGTDVAGGIGTAPEIVSITTPDTNPTNAANVNFTVTFSEPVTGFVLGDCGLTATAGTLNGAALTGLTPASGDTYTVTAARGTGNVTFQLDVAATGAIVDAANNPMVLPFTTGNAYTIQELAFIQNLPATDFVTRGDTISVGVQTFGGVTPKTYVWYYSPTETGPFTIDGSQTLPNLEFDPVEMEDAGYYYVTVSDANESIDSDVMLLSVDDGIPAAGLGGLALAGLALAGIAARRIRARG